MRNCDTAISFFLLRRFLRGRDNSFIGLDRERFDGVTTGEKAGGPRCPYQFCIEQTNLIPRSIGQSVARPVPFGGSPLRALLRRAISWILGLPYRGVNSSEQLG